MQKPELSPDLIILDYDLPGMNGLDFLDRLRQLGNWKHLPVIMLNIYEDAEIMNQVYQKGVMPLLSNPKAIRG